MAVMASGASYYAPWWETVLAFGDTGDDAELEKAPRRLRTDSLPPTEEADFWTAPNTGSQHYEMPWDAVLAYASVVGTGEEGTQAGQATSRGLDEAAAREDVPRRCPRRVRDALPARGVLDGAAGRGDAGAGPRGGRGT